ncbi:MAG TPA: response regulator, partial [Dehalococcoidia bacterium]|nr:response regulator [Dehalococcoidia bacterium]
MAEVSGAQSPTVLIVDENDDSRVELRKLLGRAGLDVAGEARYGANAAAAAYQLQPAVILVGVDEPPNRALETIERLTQLLLETPIIAYSSMDEAGAIRRATRAGVRDYLTRPIDPDTLRESVLSVLAHEERLRNRRAGGEAPPPHGTIITVTGAKGGVGKSVVAINLALGLRQVTGHSVALLDADTHFGDVAMMLNLPADPPVTRSIGRVDTLDRETVVDQTVLHPSGIRILPGPAEPDGWEEVAPEQLERFIHLLAEAFDFVIIDTPDRFDHVVQQCVQSATLTMLVSSLDISSIADTKVALRLMHRWDYPPEKVRLTVNRTRK